MKKMYQVKVFLLRLGLAAMVLLIFSGTAWAGGADAAYAMGAIAGWLTVTVVMFRIHPILGMITFLSGLARVGKIIS